MQVNQPSRVHRQSHSGIARLMPPTAEVRLCHRSSWSSGARNRPQDAADRCPENEMPRWSDEVWQDTAIVYVGAAILVGIADTEWSLSPRELRDYRDFLDGSGAIAAS